MRKLYKVILEVETVIVAESVQKMPQGAVLYYQDPDIAEIVVKE